MRKIYTQLLPLFLLFSLCLPTDSLKSQCLNTFPFGSIDAGTLDAEVSMIDNCNFFGDYSVVTNITEGSDLRFFVSNDGFITVREGSFDGPIIASADSALTIFNASGDDLYLHWNSNVTCGTLDGTCVETFAQCLNCDGCVGTSQFVSFDLTGTEPDVFQLTDCNWRGEYNEITGVPASETIEFTASSGYITVREGTPNGPIVGEGFSPVQVNTSGANLYVHHHSDDNCTANDLVSCIDSRIQCISCLYSDPMDGSCYFPGEFGSVTIDPTSSEEILISNCNFQGEHSEVIGTLGKDIKITSSITTYMIVRGGAPNGPVIADPFFGASTLEIFDVSYDKIYIHWALTGLCATATTCLQTKVQCTSCGVCPDGNVGDPCDDGDPNTFGTVLQTDCSCGGGFFGPVNDICDGVLPMLNCGVEVVGNTETANPPEFQPSGCDFGGQGGNDVWYSFETDGTQDLELRLRPGPTAAFWVGNMYVYQGNCEIPDEIACTTPFTSGDATIDLGVLTPGTYYVQVFSESALENSFRLRLKCSEPCNSPFPAVDESSLVTLTGVGNIITEWSPVPGQIGCQIQVRFAGGSILGSQIVGGANADGFNIPLSVLQPGTDYEWRVRCGCSQTPLVAGPFSSWQPFTTFPGITMTSNPNPTEGLSNVTFNLSESSYATLEVFDMNGRMIESLFAGYTLADQEYRFEFDGSNLPNGIYIYRLTTDQEIENDKFIIAK
ncbi:MAG: T9SS type A sorting domain-containing protein [Bacteroidota bacterium]